MPTEPVARDPTVEALATMMPGAFSGILYEIFGYVMTNRDVVVLAITQIFPYVYTKPGSIDRMVRLSQLTVYTRSMCR